MDVRLALSTGKPAGVPGVTQPRFTFAEYSRKESKRRAFLVDELRFPAKGETSDLVDCNQEEVYPRSSINRCTPSPRQKVGLYIITPPTLLPHSVTVSYGLATIFIFGISGI